MMTETSLLLTMMTKEQQRLRWALASVMSSEVRHVGHAPVPHDVRQHTSMGLRRMHCMMVVHEGPACSRVRSLALQQQIHTVTCHRHHNALSTVAQQALQASGTVVCPCPAVNFGALCNMLIERLQWVACSDECPDEIQ